MFLQSFLSALFILLTQAAPLDDWTKIEGPWNDTRCAWGNPWHFYHRPGRDAEKLVIFFQGGGACWDAESCLSPQYIPFPEPPYGHSFFNNADQRNPVADWSFLFLPYCTGDAHLGTQIVEFSSKERIHFWGRKNFEYALKWYQANIRNGTVPSPDRILTSGCSAGSVGSYINILVTREYFPLAKHYHWADSFLPVFGKNSWNQAWKSWPFEASLPDIMNKKKYQTWTPTGTTEMMTELERLFDVTFHSSAHRHDKVETAFYIIGGGGAGLSWSHYANSTLDTMHELSSTFGSFIYPGDGHCSSDKSEWWDMECDGWHLYTWIDAFLNGRPYPNTIYCS